PGGPAAARRRPHRRAGGRAVPRAAGGLAGGDVPPPGARRALGGVGASGLSAGRTALGRLRAARLNAICAGAGRLSTDVCRAPWAARASVRTLSPNSNDHLICVSHDGGVSANARRPERTTP